MSNKRLSKLSDFPSETLKAGCHKTHPTQAVSSACGRQGAVGDLSHDAALLNEQQLQIKTAASKRRGHRLPFEKNKKWQFHFVLDQKNRVGAKLQTSPSSFEASLNTTQHDDDGLMLSN